MLTYAAERLIARMHGLTDDEWNWAPIPGDTEVTICWRLDHITETLAEGLNWVWLGQDLASALALGPATSADEAVAALRSSVSLVDLTRRDSVDLSAAMGDVAGPFADSTGRALVLHVADELIHHAAEAALIRDLHAARSVID